MPQPTDEPPGVTLIARGAEQEAIDLVVDAARQRLSGVLVLSGEPGVGKTALLEQAMRASPDLQVAAVAGVESEAGLGHAALHRLVLPFLDRLEQLPDPQRNALGAAFGLHAGDPPDRFLVGLATLTLLSDVAAGGPLLCVVDDAQWVDPESLAVLAFVARRLLADGVSVLFGLRLPSAADRALADLPALTVGGLDESSALALLRDRVPGFVDTAVARRLAAETLGNPLALVELARELTPGQLAGAELLPSGLPLGAELEERFLRQVRDLPVASQLFLLVAAADSSGDRALVDEAAAALGLPEGAAEPAAACGLLVLDAGVTFRHPMVRSAVLAGAADDDLRRAHAALATVIGAGLDLGPRAWHLAEATAEPDDDVAAEVEAAAHQTIRRGGYATAAALLDHSGRLSSTSAARGRRLLAAAEAHLAAGNTSGATETLARAGRDVDDERIRAEALRLEGAIRLADGQIPGTPSILVQAALALAPFDVHVARDTLLEASSAAIYGGHDARREAMAEVARAAGTVPPLDGAAPTSGDLLLDAFSALFTLGPGVAAPQLRRAVDAVTHDDTEGREVLRWLGFGCWAAGAVGDNDGVLALGRRLVALSRDRGALGELTRGLYFLGIGEVVAGDLASASAHFSEGRDLMATRGGSTSPGEVVASAWRGDEDETHHAAAAVVEAAGKRGQGGVAVYTDHAITVLELGLGHYERALGAALRVDEEDSYFLSTVALPDLVEAAARADATDVATDALERCRQRAEANDTALALGLAARAAALLAHDDEAERLHNEALDCLRGTVAVGHLARAHLLYGEWLRRRQRRLDAREQLRAAHEGFVAIGAHAFAGRAAHELEATGERVRKRAVETASELTPQEAKVAGLAAERATNGEIAAQLFISPATVDYHLRKVYRKLGISSRRDLARALSPPG